jgi:antitoxin component of RelBE/YafQ-DinJ toxin-antitoxin module
MKTVNLQVPISEELRLSAQEAALEQGFSSVQEAIRIFLNKLASKTIEVVFTPKTIKLSKKAEKRYLKIAEEIERGEGMYKAKDVDDLMKQLKS